jgi:NAD(P)H-nitrite reductase large subunit
MIENMICYCFSYTEEDIRKDFAEHGRSTIMERIMAEKKKGKCRCETTNPKGR